MFPEYKEMNVPEHELVYIDSVNENETKCAMKNITDSNFKNVEMVSETTWYKNISLDVKNKCFDVNFKLDTRAEVNILPLYILSMFKVNPKLSKTNISLTTYVNVKSKSILGLRDCKELKLIERINAIECSISKNELIKQYKDVFTGVGEFSNEPYHITLKDNAVPVIHPPRRVPLALQKKLKSTLDRLEKEGIESKVNKPTDWVQSFVIVEKPNGNLRLCV
ncbi:transposon Ty3-I Gag-Pol polyprotein [Trichonephila clavipes]|nr:transposon Ty3-I Gag-Pol polyprotein [Trichonephila clavipes]